jgi:hypothetical protein
VLPRKTVFTASISPQSAVHESQEVYAALTWRDWRPVGAAALVALLLGGGLLAAFGGVSPYARPSVLSGLTETVFWLAASIIGVCGTIAALMLTTVGLLEHLETDRLTPRFLFNLRLIVTAAVATIGLAVIALLLTVFPTSGADGVAPANWVIESIYWAELTATSLMIGGFATVLSALYTTIGEIFRTLPRRWVQEILSEAEEDEGAVNAPV